MNSLLDFLQPVKERKKMLHREKRSKYYRDNREVLDEKHRLYMLKHPEKKQLSKRVIPS